MNENQYKNRNKRNMKKRLLDERVGGVTRAKSIPVITD